MPAPNRLRIHVLVCLVTFALVGGTSWADEHETESVVVHLSQSTNDLHAASMALKLGAALAKKGSEVTLFVDLEGVRIADTRQPLDLRWGSSPTLAELYRAFVESGGKILVCPHCAAAVGLTKGSLREGAVIGTTEDITTLLTKASKILDY